MGYAWDAQRGSKRRLEANLNAKVKPKQELGNFCGKKLVNARSTVCGKTWWICVQLVTN